MVILGRVSAVGVRGHKRRVSPASELEHWQFCDGTYLHWLRTLRSGFLRFDNLYVGVTSVSTFLASDLEFIMTR